MSSGGKKGSKVSMPSIDEMLNKQAGLNRLNQFTPGGNLVYGRVGEDGSFVADREAYPHAVRQEETPHARDMRELAQIAAMALARQVGAQATTNLQPLRAGNERPIEGEPLMGRFGLGQGLIGALPSGGGRARAMMRRR